MANTDWTPASAAEDLVAQIEDLAAEGAHHADIAAALEREGLAPRVADDVMEQVTGLRPATRPDANAPAAVGIDAVPLRRAIRVDPEAADVDPGRVAALAQGLVAHGLKAETAQQVADALAATDRAITGQRSDRLRRLGLQAMLAGVVFGGYFLASALVPRQGNLLTLVTAAGCAAMAGYGYVLWRNHRKP
ncbi:MAG: hypothetical protein HY902_17035 [Deltaproteobacteria bacterium]|nr:hypothetical protein [Deltaproteobacteria bacterium]